MDKLAAYDGVLRGHPGLMLAGLAVDALPGIVQMGLWFHLFLSLVGMALMLAAVIGALLFRRKRSTG